MAPNRKTTAAARSQRVRRSLVFEREPFLRTVEAAVDAESMRWRAGRSLSPRGTPLPLGHYDGWDLERSAGRALVRTQVWSLLKAFIDAARPAGGLNFAADGWPVELEALVARGKANSAQGESESRFERQVRRGGAIDLRLAEAALAALRLLLERPRLQLHEIGAVENHRLRAARRIEAVVHSVSEALPQAVVEGLVRRAEETAGYPWLLDGVEVEYRDLRLGATPEGTPCIRLTRSTRYRTVKLVRFASGLQLSQSYEWHEWSRCERARLFGTAIDADGRYGPRIELPIRKHLCPRRELVVFEVELDGRPDLAELLHSPAVEVASDQAVREWEWVEDMVFGAADRDIVVSCYPMHDLRIRYDADANPDFVVAVGDSPGLLAVPGGWRLERTLMPREVLAVRIRWRGLRIENAAAYRHPPAAPAT
jgi:hypothetical protein